MDCRGTGKCSFMKEVTGAMPYTAQIVRINYCKEAGKGCARDAEHVILNIDKELNHLGPGKLDEFEIVEKVYYGGYKELRVRSR